MIGSTPLTIGSRALATFYSLLGVSGRSTTMQSSSPQSPYCTTFYSLLGVSCRAAHHPPGNPHHRNEHFLLPFGSFQYEEAVEQLKLELAKTFYSLLGVSNDSRIQRSTKEDCCFLLPFGSFNCSEVGTKVHCRELLFLLPFGSFPEEFTTTMSCAQTGTFLLPFGSFETLVNSMMCIYRACYKPFYSLLGVSLQR